MSSHHVAELGRIAFLLIQNGALLALGVMGYCQVRPWLRGRLPARAELLLYGVVFGGLGVLSILGGIDAGNGVRLDLRNAMVAVATVFGGLEAGCAATLVIVVSRLAFGGGGVAGGISSLVVAFAISAAFVVVSRRRGAAIGPGLLLVLGVFVALSGLAVVVLFPRPVLLGELLIGATPSWFVLLPLTIVFLGQIVIHSDRALALSELLAQSESRLRTIMDNAPFAIYLKDRDGRYQLVNRCFETMMQTPSEAAVGRSNFDILPAALAQEIRVSDREVTERGSVVRIEKSPSVPLAADFLSITKFPIRDEAGRMVGTAGFIADISDRKKADDELRQSEERFRALVEHSRDGIFVLDRDGRIKYRSPSDIYNLRTDDEVIGWPAVSFFHADDREALLTALRTVGAQPGNNAAGRGRVSRPNGTWTPVAWSAHNATDVPSVAGIIINLHDTAEQNRLENELMQARKMEAVGQLAGGIAHDFNNILGAILGFAGFLQQDLARESPQHRFADRIVTAAMRARGVVQQILTFSRGNSVERVPSDLVGIVNETRDLLQASLPASTTLRVTAEADWLIADVNATEISQVLLNLCLNAQDALGDRPGGIAIVAAPVVFATAADVARAVEPPALAGEARLAIGTLRPDQPYARISVDDTGAGMDEALLYRIFDPFFTTKERGRGTGLGLAVAHGIVLSYDGAWMVRSVAGEGSSFACYLPLTSKTVRHAANAAAAELRGSERILVVDDETDLTDVLTIALDRLGYEVVGVNDPVEALEVFAEDPTAWDVVISDQVMPQMKGLALLENLRALRPSLPFVLCTGFSDGASEAQAFGAGADAYFVKPVAPADLAAAIRRLVDLAPVG